ncbi:syntaxin-17-like [Macrosteles quadrilineatus]|uniref:syntaxin-17-like n=1 Tax=Macrosteles quadrilineatus TaxID=74068 RepID=UPI0023E2358C|nr:syntaxin-17-like [Macrosteles quadrilineatus]
MGFDGIENHNDSILSSRKSVKWLEVPIQKFNEIVPHFVQSLKTHHSNIIKLRRLEQWEEVRREEISATQIINQLAALLSEMENLRSQVTETDLNKFDRSIISSKRNAKAAIRSFHDACTLSKRGVRPVSSNDEECENEDQVSGEAQLVAIANISEAIKIKELTAASMERLEEDIQDINYMFQELSQMVHEQGEAVERIETHVETTLHNVTSGERMLAHAARLKSGMYPLMGALLGSVLGGPVGLFAGFKLGSLTAVGAGVLGFTGGKMIKHKEETLISASDLHSNELKSQG